MRKLFIILCLISVFIVKAQEENIKNVFRNAADQMLKAKINQFWSNEFSKEISLEKTRLYIVENILDKSETPVKFEFTGVAPTSSRELITLCPLAANAVSRLIASAFILST